MFTASCDYVRKLVPPLSFERQMSQAADRARLLWRDPAMNFTSQIWYGRQDLSESFMGTNRYANEHWITSHPDLKPCVVRRNHSKPNNTAWAWSPAPILPLNESIKSILRRQLSHENIHQRRKEYILLPGKLFLWNRLYEGARPPVDSWFWSYFPDGSYFRDQANFTLM